MKYFLFLMLMIVSMNSFAQRSNKRSLNDYRSSYQPAGEVWGNGLLNAGTNVATTFVNFTAGITLGGIYAIVQAVGINTIDDDYNLSYGEKIGAAFMQNPIFKAMRGISESVRYNKRIYKSDEYSKNIHNGDWGNNMGTAAFWSDVVLGGIGTLIGAILGIYVIARMIFFRKR